MTDSLKSGNNFDQLQQENSNHFAAADDESELVRQLRIRIAELEGAQRMTDSGSVASFDVLGQIGNEFGEGDGQFDGPNKAIVDFMSKHFREKFAQIEMELKDTKQLCTITKLENKALQSEFDHHKLLMKTELNVLQVKMAEMEKEKEEMACQFNQLKNKQKTEFDQMKQKHENDSKQLKTKIEELAQQLNNSEMFKNAFPSKFAAIENFVGVLKDRFGNELLKAVHPDFRVNFAEKFLNPSENCWNSNASHNDLDIFGPKSLMVHYKKEGNTGAWPWRVVFAKFSVPIDGLGIFYYELKILNMKRNIRIGFATKNLALDGGVGEHSEDSYGYVNDGTFWMAKSVRNGVNAKFGRDDVIGCGVNLVTGRIIFTKNGKRLDTSNLFVSPTDHSLFPAVSLLDCGDLIDANFGPEFKFKLANV